MSQNTNDQMDKIVSLCKRKGFIFQNSEIYGGLNSCWDYGPLGVELKRNVHDYWWFWLTQLHSDIEGLETSILMHPRVWEASGHVESFTDPMVDCKICKRRFKADDIEEEVCPSCGGELTGARQFNLMFKTFLGPVEDDSNVTYLRPETAQGSYVNYQNVMNAMRRKIPFGIAQVGKAFRNEITPGNFTFRTREFEQMEMQYFVKPGTDEGWFEAWKEDRTAYYKNIGINPERLRFREHGPDELAHYAKRVIDIEYEFPFGWAELEGIHNRTDFDLKRHQEYSGKDMSYFDEETRESYIPYVVETAAGLTRTVLVCLIDGYDEEMVKGRPRVILRLHPRLAPIKAGIFPLVKRDGMPEIAREIEVDLRRHLRVFYDENGAVGRRYRRMDEVGTPYCITVDSETKADDTVTVRDRDTMEQIRVKINQVREYLEESIENWKRPERLPDKVVQA